LIEVVSRDEASFHTLYSSSATIPHRKTVVSRAALAARAIDPDSVPRGLSSTEGFTPAFDPAATGFDVVMADRDRVLGIVTIEYEPGSLVPGEDRAYLVSLVFQLATALANARSRRESRYLRDYATQLLDHANALIVVIGRHREIRVVNRAFLALTGSTRDELLGRDFADCIAAGDRAQFAPVFANALRGLPASGFETSLGRRDGARARVALNVASVFGSDDSVEAVIAIGRDLTEVQRLEEQVLHAGRLATLGQLAAGVVHELNNPLTSIAVYGDYLLKKFRANGAEQGDVEKLSRIVDSADRILRFSRDLVAYARPSSESPSLVTLNAIVDQSAVFCEHLLARHKTTVVKNYGEGLPQLMAVRGQLHQVFINLITNACHAMERDPGTLTLETASDGDDFVVVRISDTGIGVPRHQSEQIFEPFFSTKGEGKGTGLGLSIVRNILTQHGGSVVLTGDPQQRTTFEVRLPVRR
jgi:two-component system NtrC family sensor kinase